MMMSSEETRSIRCFRIIFQIEQDAEIRTQSRPISEWDRD
jgi:hypothetical protein